MNASQSGSALPRILGGSVIVIVAAVLLYYLYDYWFNIGGLQQKAVIIPNPVKASALGGDGTLGTGTTYPESGDIKLRDYIYTGGELSTSFWVYVTGMSNFTKKKHLISLESGTNEPTLIVALGAKENTLYVRVRDGSFASGSSPPPTFSKSTFMTTDTAQGKESPFCSVSNFESGRWVNVVVVLNNNISDVYVDGKLTRSCKLKGQWQVDSGADALAFKILQTSYDGSIGTGLNGSFSNFVYYNYALSPDQVYRIYMAGPSGGSVNLWEQIKRFFGASKETTPVIG